MALKCLLTIVLGMLGEIKIMCFFTILGRSLKNILKIEEFCRVKHLFVLFTEETLFALFNSLELNVFRQSLRISDVWYHIEQIIMSKKYLISH